MVEQHISLLTDDNFFISIDYWVMVNLNTKARMLSQLSLAKLESSIRSAWAKHNYHINGAQIEKLYSSDVNGDIEFIFVEQHS